MLKQCPRCANEEIEGANYCKICGLKLKEAPEVPAQEQTKRFIATDSQGNKYSDEPANKNVI